MRMPFVTLQLSPTESRSLLPANTIVALAKDLTCDQSDKLPTTADWHRASQRRTNLWSCRPASPNSAVPASDACVREGDRPRARLSMPRQSSRLDLQRVEVLGLVVVVAGEQKASRAHCC
jgi:hypothetical protein